MKKQKLNLSHNTIGKINLYNTNKEIASTSKNIQNIKIDFSVQNYSSALKLHSDSQKKIQRQYYTNTKVLRSALEDANTNIKQNLTKKISTLAKQKKSYSSIRNQKLKRAGIDLSNKKFFVCESSGNILTEGDKCNNQHDEQYQNRQYKINMENRLEFQKEWENDRFVIEFDMKNMINNMVDNIFDKNILLVNKLEKQITLLKQQSFRLHTQKQQAEIRFQKEETFIKNKNNQLLLIIQNQQQKLRISQQSLQKKDEQIRFFNIKLQQQFQRQNIEKKKLQIIQIEYKALEQQIQKLKNQMQANEKQTETFKKEVINLKKQINVLKKQNTTLKNNVQHYETSYTQLDQLTREQTQKIQNYKNLINSLESQLEICKQQLKKTDSEKITELTHFLNQIKQQNYTLVKNNQMLQIKMDLIQKKNLQQFQRFKQTQLKESKVIKEKNKKLIKSNILLKRMLDENKTIDQIQFSFEDNKQIMDI